MAIAEQITEAPQRSLLDKLKERTAPVRQIGRGPSYNHPNLWYMRSDGDVVKLQGDPASRAYYEDKGYTVLRPDEVREWEKDVRPVVIADQRKRASLITTMRRIAVKHPGVELAGDLDITPTDELQAMLEQLKGMTGGAVAVVTGRFREEQPAEDREAGDTSIGSADALQQAMARSAARGQGRR